MSQLEQAQLTVMLKISCHCILQCVSYMHVSQLRNHFIAYASAMNSAALQRPGYRCYRLLLLLPAISVHNKFPLVQWCSIVYCISWWIYVFAPFHFHLLGVEKL